MTIKEMAEKEFPIKSFEERHAGDYCRQLYCMGANAVLEEIYKELTGYIFESRALEAVYEKVMELKGE